MYLKNCHFPFQWRYYRFMAVAKWNTSGPWKIRKDKRWWRLAKTLFTLRVVFWFLFFVVRLLHRVFYSPFEWCVGGGVRKLCFSVASYYGIINPWMGSALGISEILTAWGLGLGIRFEWHSNVQNRFVNRFKQQARKDDRIIWTPPCCTKSIELSVSWNLMYFGRRNKLKKWQLPSRDIKLLLAML